MSGALKRLADGGKVHVDAMTADGITLTVALDDYNVSKVDADKAHGGHLNRAARRKAARKRRKPKR